MFGIFNKTIAFATKFWYKVGNFTIDVAVGYFEEISFNATHVNKAYASVIPDQLAQPVKVHESLIKLIKGASIATTSVVTSPQVRSKAFEIISASTWNLM